METELIRFRIDPALAQQAEQVCAEFGFELRDVLRATVTRIARDHVVPFDMKASASSEARRRPFYEYDERLWATMKPPIDAEVALALLARYIANCSTRIDEAEQADRVDRQQLKALARTREEARAIKLALDVTDSAAVQRVLDRFGPLVRATAV
jgi:addiction module RelB/DinJ family antitoxin